VRAGPHLIIIDAGTGIIGLGKELAARRERDGQPVRATMLFTHGHHDHTQGFPYFRPLYFPDSTIHIFGLGVFGEELEDMLKLSILPPMFPAAQRAMPGLRSAQTIHGHQAILIAKRGQEPKVMDVNDGHVASLLDMAVVRTYHSSGHPKGGCLCYRVEYAGRSLVFATDTEGYIGGDTLLSRFVRGSDLLIHDAEYTEQEYTGPPSRRQGWGHSTWKMALTVARRAAVKRVALTHHSARHGDAFLHDLEDQVRQGLSCAFLAREGMTIEL
jgi:phosphoribosyl 1,2-cyclic phosphodiesterase